MGMDKDGSKGGGFFQLFDWKAKSRKKLFSSKSEITEHSKQGKRNDGNLPRTRVYLTDEDENGLWSNSRRNSDYSCASSVTDEEGCRSRGSLNVVARLMGLNSMPAPYSSAPSFDTQSLCDSQRSFENSQSYQATYKTEEPVEVMPQRIPNNRPIEKFQTETLPPKSAKTIPITQNKLLSPVKCPGFVPSRDPACIMEAAAKIIESSASHSNVKSKGSTSGQMKVVDLRGKSVRVGDPKENVESTRKTSRIIADSGSTSSRYLRGHSQSLSKSYNGVGTFDNGSSSVYKNEKSISLAIQAKVNVQKREGLNSSARHDVIFKPERDNSKSDQILRSKSPSGKKSPALNASGALKQNSQKQNSLMSKERLPSKTPISSASKPRKPLTESIRTKSAGSSQTGSRKLEMGDKEMSQSSSMRNFPRKKRSIHQNKKQVQASSVVRKNWIKDSRREGTDVVSFTFTAPLSQKSDGHAKLRGLTCGVVSSSHQASSSSSAGSVSTAASAFQELAKTPDSKMRLNVQKENDLLVVNKLNRSSHRDSSRNPPLTILNHEFQGIEDMELDEEYDVAEVKKPLDSHHPSPVSVLESSLASESWISSESTESNLTEVNKQSTTSQGAETLGSSFSGNSHSTDIDMDISDSASSLSCTLGTMNDDVLKKSINWELEYVKEILSNVEKMYKDFTLGRACSVVTPHLFDQLESGRKGLMETDDGDSSSRVRRKALFDCVRECMDLRFKRGGGSKSWETGLAMARKKELAEEVYRDIIGWRGMADSIVDDLVNNDMSGRYGKWFEFQPEVFEVGVEIETELLSCLVEEAIASILRL